MIWLAYLLLGSVAGLLAGLFGIGGGVVLVPAFIALFMWQDIAPQIITYMAIGSSLACIVFSATSSTWAHHKENAVQWSIFWSLVPGICLGAWLGVHTAVGIPEQVLRLIIGVFLVLLSVKMLSGIDLGGLFKSNKHTHKHAILDTSKTQTNSIQQHSLPGTFGLLSAGGIIGWVSAIFGIGGGTLTVPFLQHCKVVMQKAVATSSACGLPIAIVGVATNISVGWNQADLPAQALGYVYVPAVLAVVAASMPGAVIGAKLAHRLPAQQLKKYFAVFMGCVGLWITSQYFIS